MLASSAFVLTALTMTGIYMQTREEENRDDGYTLDFTTLEDNAQNKYQEIAENNAEEIGNELFTGEGLAMSDPENMEDDLDYMPMEVGSGRIELPGLTDAVQENEKPETDDKKDDGRKDGEKNDDEQAGNGQNESDEGQGEEQSERNAQAAAPEGDSAPMEEAAGPAQGEPDSVQSAAVTRELHFAETNSLLRPVEGEVLLPYSMDGSVFFSTLKHYAYNPALMLVAQEGMNVSACAEGRVVDIFEDARIGKAVTMDLGDGYQITYGQLKDINVGLDSYVDAGEIVGQVAEPTKYYRMEGANLYLKLTLNGTPVDPEALFR